MGSESSPVKLAGKKEKVPVGDIQTTFTVGLSGKDENDGGVFLNKTIIEES